MPLKLYKRPNGVYHLRGTVQGERFDHSTRTRDRGQAEEIRAKAEADAFRAHVYGERAVLTFAEAAVNYMRAGGERVHLAPLLSRFGTMRLADVTQKALDELAAEHEAAPATLIRQIYTPAAAVINHSRPEGTAKVSFRKPRVRNARTAYLTPAQAEAWLEALPPYLSGLLAFLLATGCRVTEALTLEWKDVSPDAERVVFWDTKSGHARGVDLQRRARWALPRRGEGRVFRNSRGEPWHGYDAINLMFRKHQARRPDLVPLHCHLCRHTWATWAYAATRDLTFLMAQGGWRSLTMVGRYAHAGSADLALAAMALGWEFSGREVVKRVSEGGVAK